jgi:hypothetical protein
MRGGFSADHRIGAPASHLPIPARRVTLPRRGPLQVDIEKIWRTALIRMRQWLLEGTWTPEKSCDFEAECEVDGRRYSAKSRHGAPNELARLLVSFGIADRPVEVKHAGIKGCITYHSFARWQDGPTRKAPRCRCDGCDGNHPPSSSRRS